MTQVDWLAVAAVVLLFWLAVAAVVLLIPSSVELVNDQKRQRRIWNFF